MTETVTNWSGTATFAPRAVFRPQSIDELRRDVAESDRCRAIGSAHSFNLLADTPGDLIVVANLPRELTIDADAGTVTVSPGTRYGELAAPLHAAGFALRNLGSLPHISIAGATATGTHGSGLGNGSLATDVRALELVTADGDLVTLARGDDGFDGAVVALGGLGIVTRVTLDIVPTYEIEQVVYDGIPGDLLLADFDALMASAYSVSVFTDWKAERFNQVWRKSLAGSPTDAPRGGVRADGPRHPIPGMSGESCTQQDGVAGPWHLRLPHFRLEFTPSSGEEIQTEYFVPRSQAVDALRALEPIADRIAAVLQISELRAVAADTLWLSMASGRDSVAVHFTWVKDAAAVAPVVALVEEALAPFAPRPHWGKVFSSSREDIAARYPRYEEFRALLTSYDPHGKFRNAYLDTYFPR